jgi:hypothetical protein
VEKLNDILLGLKGDLLQQEILKKNIASMAIPDAAERIAVEALKLCGRQMAEGGRQKTDNGK